MKITCSSYCKDKIGFGYFSGLCVCICVHKKYKSEETKTLNLSTQVIYPKGNKKIKEFII